MMIMIPQIKGLTTMWLLVISVSISISISMYACSSIFRTTGTTSTMYASAFLSTTTIPNKSICSTVQKEGTTEAPEELSIFFFLISYFQKPDA